MATGEGSAVGSPAARDRERGTAGRILLDLDADSDKLHNEVIRNSPGPAAARYRSATESARASSGMLEHLSERARDVIDWARREARALGHVHIGGEHILLGLLREREGLAGPALEARGVTLEQARARVLGGSRAASRRSPAGAR